METAIGVFSSRWSAERAVRELREHGVPEECMVFLTCSEGDAKKVGRALGKSGGMKFGKWSLPDLGAVFAAGFGAAALLGIPVSERGGTNTPAITEVAEASNPTINAQDVEFFRKVLKAGRSLVVVRTESAQIASSACTILDRAGIGMQGDTAVKMQIGLRSIGDVTVLDIGGRITFGEGNVMLRRIVDELSDKGTRKIVLNLAKVNYVDSSGIGELVRTHTRICKTGGLLKLASLSPPVRDLLEITRLAAVFDIKEDEASALQSFEIQTSARAIA